MSDISVLAEELTSMNIQVNFKASDVLKFFGACVVANVIGYSIVSHYQKKKENADRVK